MAIDYSSEINALTRAIASGATEVYYEGKRVQYDSFEKLLARLNWLKSQEEDSNGVGSTRRMAGFASFDRGDC